MNLIDRLYAIFLRIANALQSPFLLAVRIYFGYQFFQNGWSKLHNLPKIIAFFTDLGIPAPALNAYFVSGLECFGGLLLIFGLGTRILSFMLAIDMIVAYLTADRDALKQIFSDPDKFMAAAPFVFLFAMLVLFFFGPGLFSIDTLIARKRRRPAGRSNLTRARAR